MRHLLRAAAATLLLTGCGLPALGEDAADPERLADLEPEEALADLPGVADVGRIVDIAPDDFYVNEVVVDTEPDVSAEELRTILEVMSYYDAGSEPVTGIAYIGAGTTDSAPDLGELGIDEIRTSGASDPDDDDRASPAEVAASVGTLLTAREELSRSAVGSESEPVVAVRGDALQIRPGGVPEELDDLEELQGTGTEVQQDPVLVTRTLEVVAGSADLADVGSLSVLISTVRVSSSVGVDDELLAQWEGLRDTLARGPGFASSVGLVRSAGEREREPVVSVLACAGAGSSLQRDRRLPLARYRTELGPVARGMASYGAGLPSRSTVELSLWRTSAPGRVSCGPFVTTRAGADARVARDVDPAWSRVLGTGVSG